MMPEQASFEELVGLFTGALENERDSAWRAGDVALRAVESILVPDTLTGVVKLRTRRTAERKLYGALAQAAHCTLARVRQLAQVSGTFGQEQRYPDVPWSLFRSVRTAAIRLNRDPRELLDEVIAQDLGVLAINALGKQPGPTLRAVGTCSDCGAHTSVTLPRRSDGADQAPIHCPVCVAVKWMDQLDGKDAAMIGALS